LIGRIPRNIDGSGIGFGVLAGCLDVIGSVLFIRASQTGRLDAAVVLSSLYPAVTVLLARFILREHFTRWKALGMIAALLAVPMIAWR
jgi:drug/metabolite transporter (DMT)-like permease